MDDLMDLMVDDKSASAISDKIKEILYTKSAEKIDASRPDVASSLFGQEVEIETEVETEVDQEGESNGD